MSDFVSRERPSLYPFNLDPTGHGAPRFKDGKLVAQSQCSKEQQFSRGNCLRPSLEFEDISICLKIQAVRILGYKRV